MSVLVAYCSQHGTTAKCAQEIASQLGDGVTLVNLAETTPKVSDFDQVVLGGSIHAGQVQKEIKAFCSQQEQDLLAVPLALFLCCANANQFELQLGNAFPASLREHARIAVHCGYGYPLEKMGLFPKLVLRMVAKVTASEEHINHEAIQQLANAVRTGALTV